MAAVVRKGGGGSQTQLDAAGGSASGQQQQDSGSGGGAGALAGAGQREVLTMGPGAFFGERALLEGRVTRSAGMVAKGQVCLRLCLCCALQAGDATSDACISS